MIFRTIPFESMKPHRLEEYHLPPELLEMLEEDRLSAEAVRWGAEAILLSVQKLDQIELTPEEAMLMADPQRDMILMYQFSGEEEGLLIGAVSLSRYKKLVLRVFPGLVGYWRCERTDSLVPEDEELIPLKSFHILQTELLKKLQSDPKAADVIRAAADDMLTTMRTGSIEYGGLMPEDTLLEIDLERDMILLYEYGTGGRGNLITATGYRKWEKELG